MFCLRSWLPLLFIPTNASPSFIFLFFLCTYFLNRPCFYCSFLLLILFLTSCNWSDRCFLDLSGNWFESNTSQQLEGHKGQNASGGTEDLNATASAVAIEMLNATAGALATAAKNHLTQTTSEWTGLGLEWLRSLLGRREWRIDCLDVNIRL
ncbi:hypothetical protein VTJ49DRAFT_3511 [Mycothermus thermophilus]|uniref:Bladder cancer-related BC10-like protein n=1 Tax=Humicola insolens TaxID=85995 RepID=A0ABR3V7T0_HUMIN